MSVAYDFGSTQFDDAVRAADLFNAFNHTQWSNATNTTLPSNVNAGRITATRPPRQMQFSLSFRF